MTKKVFRAQHLVRFSEVDAGQALYHPRYLDILCAARESMFRELGHSLARMLVYHLALTVADLKIKYRKPCFLEDLLTIESQVLHHRSKVIVLEQKVFKGPNQEVLATEAEVTLVSVSLQPFASVALPQTLLDALV